MDRVDVPTLAASNPTDHYLTDRHEYEEYDNQDNEDDEDSDGISAERNTLFNYFESISIDPEYNEVATKKSVKAPKKVSFSDDHGYFVRTAHPIVTEHLTPSSENGQLMVRSILFNEEQFHSSIFIDYETLTHLYCQIKHHTINGLRPILPFTQDYFPVYLFQECADLNLIMSMLNFCRTNPGILGQIAVKFRLTESFDLRDDFMFPFLLKVHRIDPEVSKITLQLMGFSNIHNMSHYYEESRMFNRDICEMLENTFMQELGHIDEDRDSDDEFKTTIYGYTNERI